MSDISRRKFIGSSAALAGAAALPLSNQSQAADMAGSHTIMTTAKAPYAPAKIINTEAMAWPQSDHPLGWSIKTLFNNDATGDHLVLIRVGIGSPGGKNHYHDFHEWAYWLTGDFVNNEYASPEQRIGFFQQFREGTFLDRPAYSLHGGEDGRLDSQVGGTCLIMEEGGKTVCVIPGEPEYSEEWKDVKKWSVPRIVDTLSEIPWEPEGQFEGVSIKRLADDPARGFRARLWRIPRGWTSSNAPQFARAHYFKQAHQFNYVLAGDLRVAAHESPQGSAQVVDLSEDFYFERPPMAVCGLADGAVTERGCVWLEVTYGKGTSVPTIPIEDPVYV